LYFGGNTKVHKADTGTDDAGTAIEATAKTAFIYFGERTGPTRYTAIRPVMASDSELTVSIGFDVDYRDGTTTLTPSTGYFRWASSWDTSPGISALGWADQYSAGMVVGGCNRLERRCPAQNHDR
jgi:hypothetical protein